MTAENVLEHARDNLRVLSELLQEAASRRQPTDEIVEEAMEQLEEAIQLLDTMIDQEGTE